jgi:hypothetical protein
VLISDGIVSSEFDGDEAQAALGARVMGQSHVLSVVLAPDNAPLPGVASGPMSALAYESKGRIQALHHNQVSGKARSLLTEFGQPYPLETLEVELDQGNWVGANLQGPLTPGSSLLALGFYEGAKPKQIRVRARSGRSRVQIKAKAMSRGHAKAFAQMALAHASEGSFPGSQDPKESRTSFIDRAAQLGVISEVSAGIAIDPQDGFAKARLALAERFGRAHYRRFPPPPEASGSAPVFEVFRHTPQPPKRYQPTGELGREIISRRLRVHAIPQARACYEKLLLRNPDAKGTITLRLEIARGEVHALRFSEFAFVLEPIRDCVKNAAFAIPMPKVKQGTDPEEVYVVHYPLRFKARKVGKAAKGSIEEGARPTDQVVDTDDPLSGLPE